MRCRLIKKLTGNGAAAAAPPTAEGDSDDAGEGSFKAPAAATKMRKATKPAQGDGSAAKSKIFLPSSGCLQHLVKSLCNLPFNQEVQGRDGGVQCCQKDC